jgi:hypothetical protein
MKMRANKAKGSNQKSAKVSGVSQVANSRSERHVFSWPGPHLLSKVHSSEYQKVATLLCIAIVTSAIGKSSVRDECIENARFYASLVPEKLYKMCRWLSDSLVRDAHEKHFASVPRGTGTVVKMFGDNSSLKDFLSTHSDAYVASDEEVLEFFIEDIHLYHFDWRTDASSD